ncbi:MAG: hypothetical protein AAF639_39145, partial [Chloroflexota bacterium]
LNFFPDNQPSWVANAKSKPMLESMGESLVNAVPPVDFKSTASAIPPPTRVDIYYSRTNKFCQLIFV